MKKIVTYEGRKKTVSFEEEDILKKEEPKNKTKREKTEKESDNETLIPGNI